MRSEERYPAASRNVQAPSSARPQYAKAMCVIQHQQRVVALAQGQQFRHRSNVAVHAEYGIRHHQFALRPGCSESLLQHNQVEVRIAREFGAGQQHRIVERGMVKLVGENFVVATGQRSDDPEIGHVAGGKKQRRRQAGESGQRCLQLMVEHAVPAHQMRRPRPHAVARCGRLRRLDQGRMTGQTEIIVTAEGQVFPAIHHNPGALRAFQHATMAAQACRFQVFQFIGEVRKMA